MSEERDGLGLAEAIEALRGQLIQAVEAGAGARVQFPVQEVSIELAAVVTNSKDGKAGFKIPFVGAELGGGIANSNATTQRVTIRFAAPIDQAGNSVKVASSSDEDKG